MISLRSNISLYDSEMENKIKLKLNLEKILVVLIVGFVFAGTAGAEDWPMFMHDLEHSGETSDVIENPDDLELKWKFNLL